MNYRLTWIEHWSTKRDSDDPRVLIRYGEQSDGWWEHEYILYFISDTDDTAREFVRKYIDESTDVIEVYSLTNRDTKEVIMTEEVQ